MSVQYIELVLLGKFDEGNDSFTAQLYNFFKPSHLNLTQNYKHSPPKTISLHNKSQMQQIQ